MTHTLSFEHGYTMPTGNITLPDEMILQLEELARAENKTAEVIATEAVKQHLRRR
jgi:predicted transcriptional regulator